MRRLAILVGEGIECEKESRRFFEISGDFETISEFSLARLLRNPKLLESFLRSGDFLFLPGGFSFSDHFGAGRLFSYQLKQTGIFEFAETIGWNVMGTCNGFQVLVAANKFGDETRLEANRDEKGKRLGFKNIWVNFKTSADLELDPLRMPVRHGEGCLVWKDSLPQHVQPFLFYNDVNFNNGSRDSVAGLRSVIGKACYWGMMPHPEIAFRPIQDPDVVGAEYFERFRDKVLLPDGDGMKLWKNIVNKGV